MPSSAEQTFSIYELAELIILQLNNPVEIARAQRVCRNWRDVIQTSPALQEACWYQSNTRDAQTRSISSEQTWKLNPAFNRIGISISRDAAKGGDQDQGDFSLGEDIYDKPGSWTTMLATQPPCQRMLFECYGDYCDDEIMSYLIVSRAGSLLMGDVMAVVAECRNRQQYGLDRWCGVRHYTGQLVRWEEDYWEPYSWVALDDMPENVSINVAIEMPFGFGAHFLHEMILHKMIMPKGHEYRWDYASSVPQYRPVSKSKYKANLLAVQQHQEGYLSTCSNVFRLLSDVKQLIT
ncbi:F-box protein [Aspergillus novofumigatus IBT 16806]|uniref:F-box domain-containing protein n=1 Tax=Aspergillus novofumigatus (strain IBT 16806) TaxID=1392255 RepID=A0A2I1BZB9_ASPN1|nr:uncharacterized protein P174DRAFT_462894 [Aspergillus novofumigatus IBT 16806]PKX90717.1 hypothetical protein P174DRAFT_462894 [Aspergillus novofumigatus IBT 16806]